jgi:hypothetical protein
MRENLDSSFDFQGVDGDYFAVAFIDSRSSVEFIEARRSGGISLESIDPKPKKCIAYGAFSSGIDMQNTLYNTRDGQQELIIYADLTNTAF